MDKYIGRRVEIIYEDSKGTTTKRLVTIYSIRNGKARVLDWGKKSFRTLSVNRILAAVPAIEGRAS
ncbi:MULTISPECIES: hypothetical protein [Cohnella]|uniref:hypothetical protein n=1 Tax=Cohnella TaxID=329857 RepID=UPI0009B96F10|nr:MULTISPECIES: hypothetical protein [Cohnella]MBN2984884.1 hypothetical protein [Cohnella algarum]